MSCTQKKTIKDTAELEGRIRAKLVGPKVRWKDDKLKLTEPGSSAAEWTNALLNIVLDLGRDDGYEVWPQHCYLVKAAKNKWNVHYAGNDKDRGEWQFDACWTRYPALTKWVEDLRNSNSQASHLAGIELACESEWFQNRGADKGVAAILDDFAKLVESRARLKLMFFDFLPEKDTVDGKGSYEDIKKLCEKLIATDTCGRYLLMAWPRDVNWGDVRDIKMLKVDHLPESKT